RAGAVTYDLLAATLDELRRRLAHYAVALRQVEPRIDWQMGLPFHASSGCAHGGAFFEAVGDGFDPPERRRAVTHPAVLGAWVPPAPAVLRALGEDPGWLLRTSPPPHAEGLTRVIARARGVGPESVLCGAGSSALIFLALRHWLRPSSRVLL